jgi:hypothetical protein
MRQHHIQPFRGSGVGHGLANGVVQLRHACLAILEGRHKEVDFEGAYRCAYTLCQVGSGVQGSKAYEAIRSTAQEHLLRRAQDAVSLWSGTAEKTKGEVEKMVVAEAQKIVLAGIFLRDITAYAHGTCPEFQQQPVCDLLQDLFSTIVLGKLRTAHLLPSMDGSDEASPNWHDSSLLVDLDQISQRVFAKAAELDERRKDEAKHQLLVFMEPTNARAPTPPNGGGGGAREAMVTLIAQSGRSFEVGKERIMKASPYFERMFGSTSFKEGLTGTVAMDEYANDESVEALVEYTTGGFVSLQTIRQCADGDCGGSGDASSSCSGDAMSNLLGLAVLAHAYEISALFDATLRHIKLEVEMDYQPNGLPTSSATTTTSSTSTTTSTTSSATTTTSTSTTSTSTSSTTMSPVVAQDTLCLTLLALIDADGLNHPVLSTRIIQICSNCAAHPLHFDLCSQFAHCAQEIDPFYRSVLGSNWSGNVVALGGERERVADSPSRAKKSRRREQLFDVLRRRPDFAGFSPQLMRRIQHALGSEPIRELMNVQR